VSGPTAWQQQLFSSTFGNQQATTNSELVIATLTGVNSRSPGGAINLVGFAQFAVDASATAVTLRIRSGSLTGSVVNGQTAPVTITAGVVSTDQLSISCQDVPSGEYAGQTYVLTIKSTAAAGNWNTTIASLSAVF
jgi:hypothetical protein